MNAWVALSLLFFAACSPAAGQDPTAVEHAAKPAAGAHETSLGLDDVGIFSDLDRRVTLAAPAADPKHISAALDRARGQLVLYVDGWPVKVYPLSGKDVLRVGDQALSLRTADRAELTPLLTAARLHGFAQRVELPPGDRDDDGIPDPLDVLLGAHKTALNADRYDGRYQELSYPDGDVPRELGVCTDVVIRALRNAGLDLQRAVHEDIVAAPRAYPMVARANASIDHRRVKSLLPYFVRHMEKHGTDLNDPEDPLRPGDVVFMDTFPMRAGAEHVGVLSDRRAPNGLLLVINNWTTGTVTRELELLSWVPVTQRFRLPARKRAVALPNGE